MGGVHRGKHGRTKSRKTLDELAALSAEEVEALKKMKAFMKSIFVPNTFQDRLNKLLKHFCMRWYTFSICKRVFRIQVEGYISQ